MTIERKINDLQIQFCPFSYLDLEFCIEVALEINKDQDWIFKKIKEYQEEMELELDKIDPCFVIYNSIIDLARDEIQAITEIDIYDIQDLASIYPNYYCTSFNASSQAIQELNNILKENNIEIKDLNLASQYFIKEINKI